MIILGIGGILGDAACAILRDGELVAAVEESKLVRRRLNWGGAGDLPEHSIETCLQLAGARPEQIDAVAVARPIPKSEFYPKLRARFSNSRLLVVEHHLAHAASAYYPSPFEEATVLTLDRGADFRCGSRWRAEGSRLSLEFEQYDSLGDLYGRVTSLLGFEANADEHKVQWMSANGDDRFFALFDEITGGLSQSSPGDGARIERSFFTTERFAQGGFSAKFYERLGLETGAPVPDALRPHIAAGLQSSIEKAAVRMAGEGRNLCFAGGLGLNALLIAALEHHRNVFVQPVSGNAGTAVGAALDTWHGVYGQAKRTPLHTLALGPAYAPGDIKQALENCKLRFSRLLTHEDLIDSAVAQLSDNKIVAWFQGRMEFGARALGNRSILASPLDPYSAENLNIFIKHREQVRKFAASVPAELASEYFEAGPNARFLATVGRVKPAYRERFAAAILAGDKIRVHTVDREENPLYWRLLHAAGKATGLPVLYNTSFNLFGEPLVCTPRDAVRSFYSSGIDAMFVGQFFLQK